MRKIGVLNDENQALILGNYLFSRKIENSILAEEGSGWGVWVHDDLYLDQAQTLFDKFVADPRADEFTQGAHRGKQLRTKRRRQEKKSRNQTVDIRTRWYLDQTKKSPLTLSLIGISILVALVSQLGANRAVLRPLFIADYQVIGGFVQWRAGLYEIMHGQVWRLITPIFIHFGFLHLVFNMLWLNDLGTMIERKQGAWLLGAQVLVIGSLSNLGQYFMSGPTFGGMSGVVYGLLGYIWIRGKFDPGSGLYLHRTIVIWMMLWFVICLTGVVGHVANTAHGVGAVVGMAWGYLSSRHWKRFFR